MRHTIIFSWFSFLLFLVSCEEGADVNEPRGSVIPPAQVSNIVVRNTQGGAIIYYDRPDDNNLKYIKAVYTTDDGVQFDANASFYTDSILVSGFGQAGNYDVRLYSVSYGEIYSEPVIVPVSPLTPPYLAAAEELTIMPTFGGVRILTENETGAKLSIGTYRKNTDGEWQEIGMYYTTASKIDFAFRGQESVEAEFGIQIRDRWGHLSEIKSFTATPWYEEECNKDLFKSDPILTDTYEMHKWGTSTPTKFENLWDREILLNNSKCFHTKPTAPMPQHFTIDLGREYLLSRFIVHGRGNAIAAGASSDTWTHLFASGHPKTFELWGSTNPNRETGEFDDSWFKIGTFVILRADGTTTLQSVSPLTDEDKALLVAGHEFIVPDGTPKLRWIRFRTLNTYGSVNAVMLDELTFFGSGTE